MDGLNDRFDAFEREFVNLKININLLCKQWGEKQERLRDTRIG